MKLRKRRHSVGLKDVRVAVSKLRVIEYLRAHCGDSQVWLERIKVGQHQCLVCEAYFVSEERVDQHRKEIHLGIKPKRHGRHLKQFWCEECLNTFPTETGLKKHVLTHATELPYKCEFCTDDVFACQKKRELRAHVRSVHGDLPYQCALCAKTFKYACYLKMHQPVHEDDRPFQCDHCCKTFKYPGNLKNHSVVHKVTRPFQCQVCEKTFKRRYSVKSHVVVHSDDKPFRCEDCDRKFKRQSTVKTHQTVHSEERPFQCQICDRTFKRRGYLKMHVVVHDDARPYQCGQCDRTFKRQSYLKIHAEVHSDARPFQCQLCDKTFKRVPYLKRHQRVHLPNDAEDGMSNLVMAFGNRTIKSKERRKFPRKRPRLPCYLCKRTYKKKTHLKKHIATHRQYLSLSSKWPITIRNPSSVSFDRSINKHAKLHKLRCRRAKLSSRQKIAKKPQDICTSNQQIHADESRVEELALNAICGNTPKTANNVCFEEMTVNKTTQDAVDGSSQRTTRNVPSDELLLNSPCSSSSAGSVISVYSETGNADSTTPELSESSNSSDQCLYVCVFLNKTTGESAVDSTTSTLPNSCSKGEEDNTVTDESQVDSNVKLNLKVDQNAFSSVDAAHYETVYEEYAAICDAIESVPDDPDRGTEKVSKDYKPEGSTVDSANTKKSSKDVQFNETQEVQVDCNHENETNQHSKKKLYKEAQAQTISHEKSNINFVPDEKCIENMSNDNEYVLNVRNVTDVAITKTTVVPNTKSTEVVVSDTKTTEVVISDTSSTSDGYETCPEASIVENFEVLSDSTSEDHVNTLKDFCSLVPSSKSDITQAHTSLQDINATKALNIGSKFSDDKGTIKVDASSVSVINCEMLARLKELNTTVEDDSRNTAAEDVFPITPTEDDSPNTTTEEDSAYTPNATIVDGSPNATIEDGSPKTAVEDGSPKTAVEDGSPKTAIIRHGKMSL